MAISNVKLRMWHRRLALVIGVFLVFQGITGAIAQYRFWLMQASAPETYRATPAGAAALPGQVLETIKRDLPGFAPAHIMYPAANSPATAVIVMGGRDPSGLDMSKIATVDQYQDRVITEVPGSAGWIGLATTLHKWTILGTTGRIMLTLLGLGTLLLAFAGLLLWWRTRRARPRGVARLHRTAGAIAGLFIATTALTGTVMNLATWYEKANGNSVTKTNMQMAMKMAGARHAARQPVVTADEAYQKAIDRIGPQHLAAFSPAGAHAHNYWFAFNDRQLKRTDVLVSPSDGSIVGVYPAGVVTGGAGIRQWLFAIHSGYVIGPVGGAFMTLVGLSFGIWFGTGIYLWRRGRRPPTH